MSVATDRDDDHTSGPLRRAELRRIERSAVATEGVPNALKSMDILPDVRPFMHQPVDRQSLASSPGEPLAPYRPAWTDAVGRPRRAAIAGLPTRKLWHRGEHLDPLTIFWPDDRKPYNDTRYPWGCVCRVVTAAGAGSGVIVGPRHVLTASHVVDWNRNGAGTVEVHRAGPSLSAISPITRAWYFTKITPPDVGWSEVDEDYAVLTTADRLGDRFGWLGVRTYDSGWDDEPYWRSIGYAAGGLFPVYQRDRELDEDEFDYGSARSMTTTADTVPGQSGSPLFAFWDDGPYVVAVVSAQGTYFLSGEENWCAGGNDMTRLVNHARANDP